MRRTIGQFLPSALCLPLAVAAGVMAHYAVVMPWLCRNTMLAEKAFERAFAEAEIPGLVGSFALVCGVGAAALAAVSLLGLARRPWALAFLRRAYLGTYVVALLYAYVVWRVTGAARVASTSPEGYAPSAMAVAGWRWEYLWPALCAVAVFAALHVTALRRVAVGVYAGAAPAGPLLGDRIVENLRTHGDDPRYRKSLLTSVLAHVAVIVVPLLLDAYGCVRNYLIPFGSGKPAVAVIQSVQRREKKKKKRFVLNPNSAIYFHVPDLDESDVLREVEEMTQLTYVADPDSVNAKMGAGGGKTGGWPEGVGNEPVRFVRLEYNGEHWDDGMDTRSRADMNFLQEFRRVTGFKVAPRSESHPIRLLKRYTKGYAPPFVYMTGSGSLNVSTYDMAVLREYLLDGGLLFADASSSRWDRSFRSFAKALFPDKRLVPIADDDPIFQMPYVFPNGAPPLWHHGGTSAMGIKHKGRWLVFYHPGDVNDAWKTGHSGIAPELAKGAFQMGINIIYYAFTHYLEATRKYRK
ncbi:MAG TPA: DUF4159 domain-containing protein [Planctomycetota bacterium]|nr:DUF4159 domain-containing protein [Planctomycetota bacterium]